MKKNWLLGVLLALCFVCLSACQPHEHEFEQETVPPTCTEEGYNRFVCKCGFSYKSGGKTEKVPHTGAGSCSVCELDYFTAAKDVVIAKGTETDGVYVYNGKTNTKRNENEQGVTVESEYYSVTYDPTAQGLVFLYRNVLEVQSNSPFTMEHKATLTIGDPEKDDSILAGEYVWCVETDIFETKATGKVYGSTFAVSTKELSYTSIETLNENDGAVLAKGMAADYVEKIILDMFIPMMKNDPNGATVKNFGFVNF